jgi:hypothetical protein
MQVANEKSFLYTQAVKWSNWRKAEREASCSYCNKRISPGSGMIRFTISEGVKSKQVVCDEFCAADLRVQLKEIEGSPETL